MGVQNAQGNSKEGDHINKPEEKLRDCESRKLNGQNGNLHNSDYFTNGYAKEYESLLDITDIAKSRSKNMDQLPVQVL